MAHAHSYRLLADMITLANSSVICTIHPKGAELISLIENASGLEYIWCGDVAWWGRHAPVLFPIVGKLFQNLYLYQGTHYELPQHGFARDAQFSVDSISETAAHFSLIATSETKKYFPFEFELYVHYVLDETTVHCTYEVVHMGTGASLLYALGAHPALNLGIGTAVPSLTCSSSLPEHYNRLQAGLLDENKSDYAHTNSRIDLTDTTFLDDALIFKNFAPRRVTLTRRDGRQVTLGQTGFAHTAFWGKPGAPFVCIEPWTGFADSAATAQPQELASKQSMLVLNNARNTHSWSLRIGENNL